MKRLKASQVPQVTAALLKLQGNQCPICKQPVGPGRRKTAALDHDHDTGYIRDVLCLNCNGIEGKIRNLVRRLGTHIGKVDGLRNLLVYWERHETPRHTGILHHTHKTAEEKRLERNAKAVARRRAKKA